MLILRAYKTELDPNNDQRGAFSRHAGTARYIYNWALADRISMFESGGKPNMFEQKKRFNAEKSEVIPWVNDIAYTAQEEEFRNLDVAYKNFFRRIKNGSDKKGFPKFKKRGVNDKFSLRGCIHIENERIKLPVIGWIRLKEKGYLPINGIKILKVTVSKRASRWFVSVNVEQNIPDPEPHNGRPIGIDVGIKTLAVLSNGKTFENPKITDKYARKIARLNKELSRRKKGSKNREETKVKLQKAYAKIANVRAHATHNISTYAVKKTNTRTVVVESLNVTGMVKNHHLAKAVSDASFGEIIRQIKYKADWNGVEIVEAGAFYPSSKTCSRCGSVKADLTLSDRTYKCNNCDFEIDRDFNAAINLAALVKAETQPDWSRELA